MANQSGIIRFQQDRFVVEIHLGLVDGMLATFATVHHEAYPEIELGRSTMSKRSWEKKAREALEVAQKNFAKRWGENEK